MRERKGNEWASARATPSRDIFIQEINISRIASCYCPRDKRYVCGYAYIEHPHISEWVLKEDVHFKN